MARLAVKSVDGLVLAVDPKKLEGKTTVLEGKNFILDADGPRSAFGTSATNAAFGSSEFVQSLELGGKQFYFAYDGADSVCTIYLADWNARQLIFQLQMPEKSGFSANASAKSNSWWGALVGGKYYVNHLVFGLWEYDSTTGFWQDVTSTAQAGFGSALHIHAITESAGRMVYLVDNFAWWSAIDDATNTTPSTTTGAGFQNLALVGTPTDDSHYMGIYKVASGFLTVLASGVMKSTIISSINPFRHDPFASAFVPLNAKCIAAIDQQQLIFLTQTGLYITDGTQFKPWQPMMSEFLKSSILPGLRANTVGKVQLHYDADKQWFFISFASSANTNLFDAAYCIYLPRDQWGMFNKVHRAFVSVDEYGDGSKLSLAYVDSVGRLAMFADTTADIWISEQPKSSVASVQNDVAYLEQLIVPPTFQVNSVTYASSAFKADSLAYLHAQVYAFGIDWPSTAGWYETWAATDTVSDADTGAETDPQTVDELALSATVNSAFSLRDAEVQIYAFARQPDRQSALDASVTVGLFRLTDNAASQQITEFSDMQISMNDAVGISGNSEDWLLDFASDVYEDWAAAPDTFVDFGLGVQPASSYAHEFIGTLDGFLAWEDETKIFDLWQTAGKTKFYTGTVRGLFCKLKINTAESGESFHLKDLEFNGYLAGVL